jgi:hypothetical protein
MNVPQLIVSMVSMTNVSITHPQYFLWVEVRSHKKWWHSIRDFIAHILVIHSVNNWNVRASVFVITCRQTTVQYQIMEIIQQCKVNNFFFLTNISAHYSFKCFNYLPVAAIINGKIFCCHGGKIWFVSHVMSTYLLLFKGLSPDLHSLEQIRQIQRPTDVPDHGEE